MDENRRVIYVILALVLGFFVLQFLMRDMHAQDRQKVSQSNTRNNSQRHGHHEKTHRTVRHHH